jgi:1-acyl-sn-glycerol-3-phosphate acyltransferase
LVYFAAPEAIAAAETFEIAALIKVKAVWWVMLWMLLMALFSGFFIVPLFALIQSRSDEKKRSRIIAANNILNSLFMVTAAVMVMGLKAAGFNVPQIFLVTAVLNLLVAIYIFTLVPEFMMRFCCWILINVMYRVKVQGLEKIPEEGPAILVSNHISFTDPLLIGGSIPRPVVFVMYWKIYELPVAKWLFQAARAIPIAGRSENEAMYTRAFDEVSRHLKAGEVVCIFPEGGLTANGDIQEFKRGVELILQRDPVPVIPMALQGLWGSMFSRWDRHNKKLKLPRRAWARVGLNIGDAMPAHSNAAQMEENVRKLRGEMA